MSDVRIRPDAIFERREDVMQRELGDGYVVYDPVSEKVHVLNASVQFVWERCDGTRTAADTVAEVCAATELPTERAAEDVYVILKGLNANGLVREL